MSERIKILQEGIDLTSGDRHTIYGDMAENMRCLAELKGVYYQYAGSRYSDAHDTALEQLFHKIARIATGQLHRDNYVDGPVYMTAAYECELAAGAEQAEPEIPFNGPSGKSKKYFLTPNPAGVPDPVEVQCP